MNPTAAAPINHDPHRRSRSAAADLVCSAVMVAIAIHLLHPDRTETAAGRLRIGLDAMKEPASASIPLKSTYDRLGP